MSTTWILWLVIVGIVLYVIDRILMNRRVALLSQEYLRAASAAGRAIMTMSQYRELAQDAISSGKQLIESTSTDESSTVEYKYKLSQLEELMGKLDKVSEVYKVLE